MPIRKNDRKSRLGAGTFVNHCNRSLRIEVWHTFSYLDKSVEVVTSPKIIGWRFSGVDSPV